MPVDVAFAPYRLAPGALPEEAARAAQALQAEPLVAAAAEPLPAPLVNRALADVPAGRAAEASEACRAADGSVAGGAGPTRACLSSDRHRARVGEAIRAAHAAGFAGVCLDRPDAALALGLLGAGFCSECQRAFARELSRTYGEHFQPVDYLSLAREAVAQSSGAVSFAQLPFGRDFWRSRHDALDRAVAAYVRAARDAARAGGRPFDVVLQLEAIGPAQLRAARHADAVIVPGTIASGGNGIGLFRLLRAAAGKRPVAITPPAGAPAAAPQALVRLASVAATCGVEISGLEPSGEAGPIVASARRLARQLAALGRAPALAEPVAECAILYSAETDLWTGGRHRLAVERAAELLALHHVQAPVVTRVSAAPPSAAIVLADTTALTHHDAKELRRRLEAGGAALSFGEPKIADELGRTGETFLPSGKPSGVRVGSGTLAGLPTLVPAADKGGAPEPAAVEKALTAILGKGRRAAGISARQPILVVLHRSAAGLDAHLVALGDRAQGATLFVGTALAGAARRGRFVSAEGTDLRIPLNPSGYSVSTVLPAFRGYAVLSLSA